MSLWWICSKFDLTDCAGRKGVLLELYGKYGNLTDEINTEINSADTLDNCFATKCAVRSHSASAADLMLTFKQSY